MTARSDYPLRRVISWWALVLFTAGTAGCAIGAATAEVRRGAWIFAAVLLAVGAAIAAIDLVVISRRMRAERERITPPWR